MITPVLLCGGAGTRLWPLSRKSYPKQFVPLIGEETPFQAAVRRVTAPGFAPPLVLTHSDFRFIVAEQLDAIGITPGAILLEPEGRNTAPAVLAAALWLARDDPEARMLVMPSDHFIPDADAFRTAVQQGRGAVEAGQLVTFGITPTYAETGYGYLELAEPLSEAAKGPLPLKRFVEKPNAERAQFKSASGRHLWNAGIYLFSVPAIINAYREHVPTMIGAVEQAVNESLPDLGFQRLDEGAWSGVNDISLDYAVMEHATNLVVVPYHEHWRDIGGWEAVWCENDRDAEGVVTSGQATAIGCTNTLLRSEEDELHLVGLGLDNIVAVAMPDAVLVANMNQTQAVGQVVATLKSLRAEQAEAFPRDHRPWGWYERLVQGDRFEVKRIYVKPGGILSLQSHHHRAEHWIVVQGTVQAHIDGRDVLLTENEPVYIPLGAKHRLKNPGKVPAILIEVRTGPYLGEDDIIRFDDAYARS